MKKIIASHFLRFFFVSLLFLPCTLSYPSLTIAAPTVADVLQATTLNVESKKTIWQTDIPISIRKEDDFVLKTGQQLPLVAGPQRMLILPSQPTHVTDQTSVIQGNTTTLTKLLSNNALNGTITTLSSLSNKTILTDNDSQTITNKTISGIDNTLLDIPNTSLVYSAIKLIAGTGISLSKSNVDLGESVTITNNGITSESDTLASITGRGATTTTALTLSNSSNSITAGTLTATGGTINGITIGASSPTTGAFSTINGLTITNNGSNTLNIAAGKTLTTNNNLTLEGTDGTTITFPSSSTTLVGTNLTQTLSNKTIAAGSNTITGLTNTNLSGSAGITNANLANSAITISSGTGISGGTTLSLGDSLTLTNSGVTSLTGTSNQVVVSGSTGAVTLSLPQNIGTSSTPTFASINGLTLTSASDGLTISGGTTSRTVTVTGADITIGSTIKPTSSGGLTVQSNGANTLTLDAGGAAEINIGTSNANAITLGADATSSANKTFSVTTADKLLVGGTIIPQTVTITTPLTSTIIDQNVFVADNTYQLTATRCVYSVAAALSGTLQVTVDTGTNAPGSGTAQLSSTINLSTTTNTVYSGSLISSPTTISAGNKVSLDVGGTLTGLLGTCTLTFKRV